MANSPLWQILWVIAAIIAGAVMFGAWTGPHRSVSNLSRWATRLRLRRVPVWLSARAADRWAFRGGLVTLVLLLAVAWLIPSQPSADAAGDAETASHRSAGTTPPINGPPGISMPI